MQSITHLDSPLGKIILRGDERALTGLWFDGQKYLPADLAELPVDANLPIFAEVERWLEIYFRGVEPDFMPAIRPEGTPFRQSVWAILCAIPYGGSLTYGEIATRLGMPRMSAQAVGGAVGHNPISILIPCHRVLGADGSLTGYAGGLDRKRWLLELESGKRPEELRSDG